jgi:two-component system cell cycle sensor histidine kinase/response regulator CckA
MNDLEHLKLLLVEDDEDDYIITQGLLGDLKGRVFTLDWEKNFEAGLAAMRQNRHDVCLVDYRLGAHDGVELTAKAIAEGCQSPIILLTGMGEHEVDMAAMKAGAADYLVKHRLNANQLERSIRYALERKRATARAAFDQARLAAFGAEVGLALTRPASLEKILGDCAHAMTQFLGATVAQIWVTTPESTALKLAARHSDNPQLNSTDSIVPQPSLDPEEMLRGQATLIKQLHGDHRLANQTWLDQHDLKSFAAMPLMLENRFVGLMSLYSGETLDESITQDLSSVAHGIALCIAQKRSVAALDASEGKYRAVVETIREVIFQTDSFGHWTFLNPAWSEVTGFDVNETMGTFFIDYVHHDDREENRHIFLQLMERRVDYCRYEARFLNKAGQVRWMEVYAQLRMGSDGTPLGLSGSLNDVTERKTAELQIQKLAAFPRVNPNPVLEFSADATLSYANDAATKMVQSLGQQDIKSILPPNVSDLIKDCFAHNQNHYHEQIVVNGRTLTWSFFPIANGNVVHCYGADVTEIVNLEAQFRHAQKLESIGQLAAGVAHDFNNILTVIQGYSDRLMNQCKGQESITHQVGQILDAARRAANLTRQLLAFSRKQVIQLKVLDLNNSVKNLSSMLSRLLGDDITLKASLDSELAPIEADAGMIEQIIMNLCVNARDAMPGGGRLSIHTANIEVTDTHAQSHPNARSGHFVRLEVDDTGCGMDGPTLGKIFEPFFSTKEVGKGTGLGLATVYGIVKQHYGWIEVASELNAGTSFKIYFPAIQKPFATGAETVFITRDIRGGKEAILLVEDEPELREMVRDILTSYDYRVFEAGNGLEALKVWDESDGAIDLLLTDMVMPDGMNGRELSALLRKRKASLKVIYSSGYSAALLASESDKLDGMFLPKPYRPAELAALVRSCLDQNIPEPAIA